MDLVISAGGWAQPFLVLLPRPDQSFVSKNDERAYRCGFSVFMSFLTPDGKHSEEFSKW